jgi:hypothetical protein
MMELVASTGSAVSPPAPRRGRREKPWPPGKQKKLLRLYICTQSERMPLVRILERLKDGSFDPRCATPHEGAHGAHPRLPHVPSPGLAD